MNVADALAKAEKPLAFPILAAGERKWRDGSGIVTVKELSSFLLKGRDEGFRGSCFHGPRNDLHSGQEAKIRATRSKLCLSEEDERLGRWHFEKESSTEEMACASHDADDWKRLSHSTLRRKELSSIPSQELMKMAELRFSRDMSEGDSGDSVSLLQSSLCTLGYLSHDSYVSGYFGTETRKALQEFQKAYGVHDSVSWSTLSKQALWHSVSAEILHRMGDQTVGYKTESGINLDTCTPLDTKAGMRIWQTIQQYKPWVIQERILNSIPKHDCRLSSGWIFVFAILFSGTILGFTKFKSYIDRSLRQQSVRRRVLKSQWYSNSGRHSRANRAFQKERSESGKGLPVENKLLCLQPRSDFMTRNAHSRLQANDDQVSERQSILNSVYYNQNDPVEQLKYGKKGGITMPVMQKDPGPESVDGWWQPHSKLWKSSKPPSMACEGPHFSSNDAADHGFFVGTSKVDMSQALKSNKSSHAHFNGTSGEERSEAPFCNNGHALKKRENGLTKESLKETDWSPRPINSSIRSTNKTWQEQDELDLKRQIEKLRKTVQAAEQNRQVAMRALAEERQRSLELEVKISRQREAASVLEEEVRILKESHDALLASLRKKYSSSAASRAAAALLYQHWDSYDENANNKIHPFKSPAS